MTECPTAELMLEHARAKVLATKTIAYFDMPSSRITTEYSGLAASKMSPGEVAKICKKSVPFIDMLSSDVIQMACHEIKQGTTLLVCSAETCGCTCRRISTTKMCHCRIKQVNSFAVGKKDPRDRSIDVELVLMMNAAVDNDMMSSM